MTDQPFIVAPLVIGHRGACGYAPENTLASIMKAYKLGVTWVEFDVMLSKDDVAIVIHDKRVDRTTDGVGDVGCLDYAIINKLDAGCWFNKQFKHEHVPTFEQVIEKLVEYRLNAVIEIKPYPNRDSRTAEKIIAIMKSHWPVDKQMPLLSSFSLQSLLKIRELAPKQAIAWAMNRLKRNGLKASRDLKCHSIHLNHHFVTEKTVAAVHSQGMKIFCYTVNRPQRAVKLFEMGVDAVFSDYPDKIMAAAASTSTTNDNF